MAKARFTLDGDVGEVVFGDPPLNLFGLELARDLAAAVGEAADSRARAVLVRAEGDNFAAGANVEIFLGRDEKAARDLIDSSCPRSGASPSSRCQPSPPCRDCALQRASRWRSAAISSGPPRAPSSVWSRA